MILVKLINENGILIPERYLTDVELNTVTSTLFNGIDAIYYQGDEPIIETTEEEVIITE